MNKTYQFYMFKGENFYVEKLIIFNEMKIRIFDSTGIILERKIYYYSNFVVIFTSGFLRRYYVTFYII